MLRSRLNDADRLWFQNKLKVHIFYRQLDFPSEPDVANEILENEAKSYLTVA